MIPAQNLNIGLDSALLLIPHSFKFEYLFSFQVFLYMWRFAYTCIYRYAIYIYANYICIYAIYELINAIYDGVEFLFISSSRSNSMIYIYIHL